MIFLVGFLAGMLVHDAIKHLILEWKKGHGEKT
jgi:hypothetical protein